MSGTGKALHDWQTFKRELGIVNKDVDYMRINLGFSLPDSFIEEDCREIVSSLEKCEKAVASILKEMKP